MRRSSQRAATAAEATLVACACALALAVPAHGSGIPSDGVQPAAKPRCVSVKHDAGNITQTVYVSNHCKKTVSWKVHRTGPDSPCLSTKPGNKGYYRWSNGLDFQGMSWNCI